MKQLALQGKRDNKHFTCMKLFKWPSKPVTRELLLHSAQTLEAITCLRSCSWEPSGPRFQVTGRLLLVNPIGLTEPPVSHPPVKGDMRLETTAQIPQSRGTGRATPSSLWGSTIRASFNSKDFSSLLTPPACRGHAKVPWVCNRKHATSQIQYNQF